MSQKNRMVAVALAAITMWLCPQLLTAQDATTIITAQTTQEVAGLTIPATNAPETNAIIGPAGKEQEFERRRGPVISFFGPAELKNGESADAVVAIGGSAKAEGKVHDAVVAIGGDAEADGEVGDAVIAIGGNARLKGKVGDAVIAIAGNAEVEGSVGDAVVAVMGNVELKQGSTVNGDVVAVGGTVKVAEGAQVKGKIVEVGVGDFPLLAPLKGATDWLKHCALKFRLVSPGMGWVWVVPAVFLLFYMLVALVFWRPVAVCMNELNQRPATTFLLGLLTKMLLPLVLVVLAMTVVGAVIIPFLMAATFIGAAIGKVALLQHFGGKIFRVFGVTVVPPLLALLTGFVLITLLYMIPFVSLLVFMLLGLWALGVVVTATFGRARKETPPQAGSTPSTSRPTGAPPAGMSGIAPASATQYPAGESTTPSTGAEFSQPTSASAPTFPVPEALALPRASFWERMGAAFLDVILVGVIAGWAGTLVFPAALAYFAGMWAWKGTTVGGVVLNLKVVRLDGKPVTFMVALVRGLASALSVIVLFLGFLWMIWDSEKQTWHDKIAGTVVVRSPRVMPLVCL